MGDQDRAGDRETRERIDEAGETAAERAGGDGAKARPGDDEDKDQRPDSAMGGAGSGGTGQVSPAAGNTVGGQDA